MANERRSFAGNAAATTLNANLTAGALTFSVASGGGTNYPDGTAGKFYVVVDRGLSTEEKILVTSRSVDTFTITSGDRGADGTSAQAHTSGAAVEHCITKQDADEANKAVNETIGTITTKGDLLVAAGSADFSRLAVGTNGQRFTADSGQTLGVKWLTPPSCRVYNSANLPLLASTWTALTFNTERFDTDTMHSTVTNTGRITFTTAGVYAVFGNAEFAGSTGGQSRGLRIRLNGTTVIAQSHQGRINDATITTILDIATLYSFSAADYVELLAYQDTSGSLNVLATGNVSPEFSAYHLGV